MADPQTENGFVMIALDLFSAIMTADLSNRCMIVLSYHLVHSYGPAKKRDVFLDPAAIEECTHLHRNNVRRAIKELCEANVFEKRPGAAYRFNKDYEGWTPGGVPFAGRLNGGAMEFAAWAINAHGRRIKRSKPVPIQPDSPPIPLDSVTTVRPNPVGLQTECLGESVGIGKDADTTNMGVVATGYVAMGSADSLVCAGTRPHKSIRFEIEDPQQQPGARDADDVEDAPSPGGSSSLPEPAPARDPVASPDPEPEAVRPPAPRTSAALRAAFAPPAASAPPAIVAPDPATVRELEDFALVTLGDRGELEDFHMQVRGWLYSFSAKHIRDTITITAAKAKDIKPGKLAAYAVKILQEPPKKPAEAPAGRHEPATDREIADLQRVYDAARRKAEEDEAKRLRRVAR